MIDFQTLNAFLDVIPSNKTPEEAEAFTIEDFPKLKTIVDETSSNFENYCGRYFVTTDLFKEKTFLVPYSKKIYLKGLPIKKVSEVVIDGETVTDYKIEEDGIRLSANNRTQMVDVTIKYFGGFEEMPADVLKAARLQIIYEYQRQDYLGAKSVSENGTSTSFTEFGLLKDVKRILEKYKNIGILGI